MRVIIVVEGGVVQNVMTDDSNLEVMFVDHDNGGRRGFHRRPGAGRHLPRHRFFAPPWEARSKSSDF
jgi:hypothetical protein